MSMNMSGHNRMNRGYTGIPTFLRSNYESDINNLEADYAVIGVPFDEGSPFMPGTRFGPRSIREHSLRFGPPGISDLETGKSYLRSAMAEHRIVDLGDIDIHPSRPELTMQSLSNTVATIRKKNALPVVIGGDHTLTYPIVRAIDEPIHVIQLDSHLDYEDEPEGTFYTNGQSFNLLHPLDHVQSLTQIGIRSRREDVEVFQRARDNGSQIMTMPKWRELGAAGVTAHIPDGEACYVSIDVDVYDMPLVPGCVSGEPNGPGYIEVMDTLKVIAERFNVIGFDFVEVNPLLDVGTGATSYLGALTVAQFLGYIDAYQAPKR